METGAPAPLRLDDRRVIDQFADAPTVFVIGWHNSPMRNGIGAVFEDRDVERADFGMSAVWIAALPAAPR